MKITKNSDFWAGSLFIILSLVFFTTSLGYPIGQAQRIGPGYFPLAVSFLLFIVGLTLTIKSCIISAPRVSPIPPHTLIVLLSILLFALLLRPLGLFAAAAATCLVSSFAGYRRAWKEAVFLALAMAAVVTAIFGWALGIQVALWPI